MKRIVFFLILASWGLGVTAQNIAVKSFRALPFDRTASSLEGKRIDQNGQVAALIKVVTTETGFVFEGGSLGIVDTRQETGEVWVWVPRSLRKITIKHPLLGVLRDYMFPVEIEAERTYEMQLVTGTVETIVKEQIHEQYLMFQIDPPDAILEVDDQMWTLSPSGSASKFVNFGTYSYRVQAPNYHPDAGKVTVNDPHNTVQKTISLMPNFGWIEVSGDGLLQGAAVYVDNAIIGRAPCKSGQLKSGQHNVRIVKELYEPFITVVTVSDNETTKVSPSLTADFAHVTLQVDADAEIWVNDERKGMRSWSGDLPTGVYKIECKRANHESTLTTKEITNQMDGETIVLASPKPIYGSLMVESEPAMATIYIDGQEVGQTPKIINEILIGEHSLLLTKDNHNNYTETVTIAKGERKMLQIELIRRLMSIMVVPSNSWCFKNGYVMKSEPDYKKALQNDSDMVKAMDKLSTLMAERGFPIENLSDAIKKGENNHFLKPDVLIELNYTMKRIGPRYSMEVHLEALDPHTTKLIASVVCSSKPTVSTDIAAMLEEALMDKMDGFCESLLAKDNLKNQK